jgi:hypothetical protein
MEKVNKRAAQAMSAVILPLHLRKNHLAKMLRRRVGGIILNDFEQGEIGPDLFRHACLLGLEGIVSKHKDQPYRAGRSKHCQGEEPNVTSDEPTKGYVWPTGISCDAGVHPLRRLPLGLREPHRQAVARAACLRLRRCGSALPDLQRC